MSRKNPADLQGDLPPREGQDFVQPGRIADALSDPKIEIIQQIAQLQGGEWIEFEDGSRRQVHSRESNLTVYLETDGVPERMRLVPGKIKKITKPTETEV